MNARHLRTHDDADLLRWLARLEENARDLRERLGARRARLGDPGSPVSDPIYQRLFFALDGIEAQRAAAERELARRAGSLVD